MRYIKTFENSLNKNIKKYIVWHEYDTESTDIEIVLVKDIVTDSTGLYKQIKVTQIYNYNLKTDKEVFIEKSFTQYIDMELDSSYILFTSDDFDKCKEYIIMYKDVNKYNL